MAVLSSTMTVLVNSLLFMALVLVQETHGLILKPLKQNERSDTITKQFILKTAVGIGISQN